MGVKKVVMLSLVGLLIYSVVFSIPKILPTTDALNIPNAFSINEDKNRLFVGYSNGRAGIWDTATGRLKDIVYDINMQSSVISVAHSNNEVYLALGHKNGTLGLWTINPVQKYGEFIREENGIWSITFSENDRYVYTANADGKLRRWDIETKILENIYTRHRRVINSARFSPDDKYLATGASDDSIILWDVDSGEVLEYLQGHSGWVTDLSFSPNSKYLISGSADKKVMVWAIPRGYMLRESREFESEIWAVKYLTETEYLVGEANGDLSLWNSETARETRRVNGAHNGAIRAIAYSPKANQVFTASNDGTVKIWDSKSLNLIATLTMANNGEWIGYMPLGKYVASANALNRDDFYVLDEGESNRIDDYSDFLNEVPFLPIGDIFGPEIEAENISLKPRDSTLVFTVSDEAKVSGIEEGGVSHEYDAQTVHFEKNFDIWEADSSTVDITAYDIFGNETSRTFQVQFEGFRFYVKEAYEDLEKNMLVVLKAIRDGRFVVSYNGTEYVVPKDKLVLSPYAPEIIIEITRPEPGRWYMTKDGKGTEAEEIAYNFSVSDIVGIDTVVVNDEQSIELSEPVKRFESSQRYPMDFGLNVLSVTATNIEKVANTASMTLIRTEEIPPDIILPPFPETVFEATYRLSFGVRDNFEVSKVLVNDRVRRVGKQSDEIRMDLPVARGTNRYTIEAYDLFNNRASREFTLTGGRVMYVKSDGTKVTDETGGIIDILMTGKRIITYNREGNDYITRINGEKGLINIHSVADTPPDIYPPGLTNLRAVVEGDAVSVKGIAYDDVELQEIRVAGNIILSTEKVEIELADYPVREARFFGYELKLTGEELLPVKIEVMDQTGKTTTGTVIPGI